MRVLGLDVGTKRIGVAISDPLGWTAQGVGVIERKGGELEEIKGIVEREGVEAVVIGLPKRMNGTIGPQAEKVLEFSRGLEALLEVPVLLWDERWTTKEVERVLLMADESRSKRRRVKDKLAAVIILQGYLDRRNRNIDE